MYTTHTGLRDAERKTAAFAVAIVHLAVALVARFSAADCCCAVSDTFTLTYVLLYISLYSGVLTHTHTKYFITTDARQDVTLACQELL